MSNDSTLLFTWLHLSDIHMGHGTADHRWDQAMVLDRLERDIASAAQRDVPRIDHIFITGDLAFSGGAQPLRGGGDEYEATGRWLTKLCQTLNVDLEHIFSVAGNHDIQRTSQKKLRSAFRLLESLRAGDESLDDALEDEGYRSILHKRLEGYLGFATSWGPGPERPERKQELFWRHRFETTAGLRIRLVGLNTALLANDDTDRKKLRLGKQQLAQGFADADPSELVIVLSHHPFDWLADEEEAERWVRNSAHIHLSGHIHRSGIHQTLTGGGGDFLRITAGAVHGEAPPAGLPAAHGYNISAVYQRSDGSLVARTWPRLWSPDNTDFRTDVHSVPDRQNWAEHPLRLRLATSVAPRSSVPPTSSARPPVALERQEEKYRSTLCSRFGRLTFKGSPSAASAISLPLRDVYVELKTVAQIPEELDAFSAAERRLILERGGGERLSPELAAQLDSLKLARWQREGQLQAGHWRRSIHGALFNTSQPALVILGDPGSGKTTLLHYLALRLASGESLQTLISPGTPTPERERPWFPIFVPLAAYDSYLRKNQANLPLQQFLSIYYQIWHHQFDLEPLFEQALGAGRAVILLDGLDEVLDAQTRRFVAHQVETLIRAHAGLGNRFAITSRFIGYSEAPLPSDVPHLAVLEFGSEEIEQFAQQWCEAYEVWAADGNRSEVILHRAAEEKRRFVEEVKRNPQIAKLAANPFLLTMLALLRRQGGGLHDRRIELYRAYVEALLVHRENVRSDGARQESPARFDSRQSQVFLMELACWLHEHHPSNTVSRDALLGELEQIALRYEGTSSQQATNKQRVEAGHTAERFLHDVFQIAGLLTERGREVYGFRHLTVQEYFAARSLAREPAERRWRVLDAHLHDPRWHEVLLLAAGWIGVIDCRSDEVDELVLLILAAGSEDEELLHRDLFLAADVAAENVGTRPAVLDDLAERLEALRPDPIPSIRNKAVQAIAQLARLGHERSIELLGSAIADAGQALEQRHMTVQQVSRLWDVQACHPIHEAVIALLGSEDELAGSCIWAVNPVAARPEIRERLLRILQNKQAREARAGRWQQWWGALIALRPLVGQDETIRKEFFSLLEDPIDRAVVLSELGHHAGSDPEIRTRLEPWLDEENDLLQQTAIGALGPLARTEAPLREKLLQKLQSPELVIRSSALSALSPLVATVPEVGQAITALLDDPEPSIRQNAVTYLGPLTFFNTRLRQRLQRFLDMAEPSICTMAISHLSPFVRSEPELERAFEACTSAPTGEVRLAAMKALAPLAATRLALNIRFEALLRDQAWPVVPHLVDTVAPLALRDKETRSSVEGLLDHPDATVRAAAIRALAPLAAGDIDLWKRIYRALDDGHVAAQEAAIEGLGALLNRFGSALIPPPLAPKLVADLVEGLKALATGERSGVRVMALHHLAPQAAANPSLRTWLLPLLQDDREDISREVATILAPLIHADIAVRSSVHAMAARLSGTSPKEKRRLFRSLEPALVHDAEIRALLAAQLQDPEFTAPLFWGLALHPKEYPQLFGQALEFASSPMWSVRFHAIKALGSLTQRTDIRQFIALKLDDPEVHVRLMAIEKLTPWAGPDQVIREALTDRLRDPVPDIRLMILKALVPLASGDPEIRSVLERALSDPDSRCRSTAAWGLSPFLAAEHPLCDRLTPWLGAAQGADTSTASFASATRRALAGAFGPLLSLDLRLRKKIEAMLDEVSWTARQGAAWALMAMPGGPPAELLPRLRRLIDDHRAEESWSARLLAASTLINNRSPELSQASIATALEALDYGKAPWYVDRGAALNVRNQAASILGSVDPLYREPAHVERLRRVMLEESEESVRDAAYQALLRLAATPQRPDPTNTLK